MFRPTRRGRIAVRVWQHGTVLPGPAGGTGRRAHLRSEWPQGRTGSTPVPGTGRVIAAELTILSSQPTIPLLRRWAQRRVWASSPSPPFFLHSAFRAGPKRSHLRWIHAEALAPAGRPAGSRRASLFH